MIDIQHTPACHSDHAEQTPEHVGFEQFLRQVARGFPRVFARVVLPCDQRKRLPRGGELDCQHRLHFELFVRVERRHRRMQLLARCNQRRALSGCAEAERARSDRGGCAEAERARSDHGGCAPIAAAAAAAAVAAAATAAATPASDVTRIMRRTSASARWSATKSR